MDTHSHDIDAQTGHTHVRPWRAIERRKSRQIMVGKVAVGGDAPISVQSMTNTLTSDAEATLAQIRALEEAGAERLLRLSRVRLEETSLNSFEYVPEHAARKARNG